MLLRNTSYKELAQSNPAQAVSVTTKWIKTDSFFTNLL